MASSQLNSPHPRQTDDLLVNQKLLRATLGSSTAMIQVLEAVRNPQNEIIDFVWLLNNQASEKSYGDVLGKSRLQQQPGIRLQTLLGRMARDVFPTLDRWWTETYTALVDSGEPTSFEPYFEVLQVRDNGIGLAEDQRSVLFERFLQVDNSTARSRGGLGLGLTLVKRLVELHGGQEAAQSKGLGAGSTFTVHLPTSTSGASSTPEPAPQATDSPTAPRILVIDDNVDAAFTLGMLLKLKGYETYTRNSGRAGIEAAEALRPSAILLDIGMPELDEYATCRLIREQPWGQAMVLIALTGYGQEEDRHRTREAGFDEHLVKPVDIAALTSLITNLLEKKKG